MDTSEAVKSLKNSLASAIVDETNFHGQTTLEVRKGRLKDALKFLKSSGFEVLMDLTGIDYLHPTKRTKIIYLLHNPTNMQRLIIALYAERGEAIPSVIDLWEGADWYQRELFDMFGITFEGLPEIQRILMPDDWKGHPLRKDYALTEESVEFKHGVKPKIPSEIIPYVKNFSRS